MQQRAGNVAPFVQTQLFADAIHAQARMVASDHSLRLAAAQNLDDVRDAIALASLRQSRDARQELPCLGRAIDQRARFEAVVAGAAVAFEDLTEIAQLYRAATLARFRVVQDMPQL